MKAHCLAVTHSMLLQPDRLASGTIKRLGMLLEAVHQLGVPIRLFCTLPADYASAEEAGRWIEERLAVEWGFAVEVSAHRRDPDERRMRWLFSQLVDIVNPWRVRGVFSGPVLRALGAEVARAPGFIIAHRIQAMTALRDLAVPLPPVYFDLDDVEHNLIWRRLPFPGSMRKKVFDAASIPAVVLGERRAVRAAARTFVCSPGDAERVNRLSGRRSSAVIPNAVALHPVAARASGAVMLMVGIYAYEPNADGAEFFINEVLPLVRRRKPEVELWLAGGSPESVPSHARPPEGVRFLGFVPDLDGVYARARLVICPIRFGSGTRIKLVEAAAKGKAIASTTLGAEGLGMISGRHALLADRPAELADACVRLIEDDALVDRLGGQARELVAATYDKRAIVAALAREFRAAVDA